MVRPQMISLLDLSEEVLLSVIVADGNCISLVLALRPGLLEERHVPYAPCYC
jgi:hypothetical protein